MDHHLLPPKTGAVRPRHSTNRPASEAPAAAPEKPTICPNCSKLSACGFLRAVRRSGASAVRGGPRGFRRTANALPKPDLHGLALDFLRSIPGWDAWGLFQDDLFFAVLCRKGQNGDSPRAIARQLVARFSPLHPVSVAVSTEKHGLGGINDAYYEVLEVLGVIDMQDRRNEALSYGDLDAMTYRQMDTTFERDRRLINRVLEGDRNGTRSAFRPAWNTPGPWTAEIR